MAVVELVTEFLQGIRDKSIKKKRVEDMEKMEDVQEERREE